MKRSGPGILLLLALAYIMIASTPAYGARESLQVTKLANPVTLDGKWTNASEWSDTNRVSMYIVQGPDSTGYLRVKHDADMLYLMVDFISDVTPANAQTSSSGSAYDSTNFGIDQNVNDTNTTQDVTVLLRWENGKSAPNPVSPPWAFGAMSYDGTKDPDSQTSHAIYEFAVPMGTFEKPSAIRVSVWDQSRGVNMHWPSWQGSWSTTYFGDLVFSEVTVPEFPTGTTTILILIALTAITIIVRINRYKPKFARS
jgi:hypothetical protein